MLFTLLLNEYIKISPYSYIASPGDDVQITIKPDYRLPFMIRGKTADTSLLNIKKIEFSGKGSEMYKCRYEIICRNIENKRVELKPLQSYFDKLGRADSLFGIVQRIVQNSKSKLSSKEHRMIRADLIGDEYEKRYGLFLAYLKSTYGAGNYSDKRRSIIKDTIIDALWHFCKLPFLDLTIDNKVFSRSYCSAILNKVRVENMLHPNSLGLDSKIVEKYYGIFRDKLLSIWLISRMNEDDFSNEVRKYLKVIRTEQYLKILRPMADNLAVGLKAYDFELKDINGNYIRLSNFRGKVVFLDFWYTGCFGCAAYYQNVVSKIENEFDKDSKVCFISINIDCSKEVWKQSVNTGGYSSPTNKVINLNTNGECADHEVIKKYNVKSYARPVLIDAEGNIFSSGKILFSEQDLRNQIIAALKKSNI